MTTGAAGLRDRAHRDHAFWQQNHGIAKREKVHIKSTKVEKFRTKCGFCKNRQMTSGHAERGVTPNRGLGRNP